jgi:calcium/calmodulin-dependent protein kinase I
MKLRCGTPGYVAPEIFIDEQYTSKVDIFSTGVIMFNLLTGKALFSGKNFNDILNNNMEPNMKNFKLYSKDLPSLA